MLRAPVQVAGAAVITQAAPQPQYLVQTGVSQHGHSGEPFYKPGEVGLDGNNLGLLQHDFRQPDPVRIAGGLPREIVAAMLGLPRNHLRGESPFW